MPCNSPSDHAEARADAVAAVAAEVAAMRRALLGSERTVIEGCTAQLERAAVAFREAFQEREASPRADGRGKLRRDLAALRRELAAVAGLAESGAALYQGLARLLGAAAGGYTAQGNGAPLRPAGSVLVRG